MLASLSPARRRFVQLVTALVALGVVAGAATALVRRVSSTEPVAQDSPGPVLLVPGYGGSTDSLAPLVQALRTQGRTTVVVTPPGRGEGDLRDQAQHLADVAVSARDRVGAESVDVIGYSAGGVVARLWVRDFGGGSVARRILTLGSPHHGAQVSALAQDVAGSCPPACRQLEPDSDLLRALNARDETPPGPVFVSIWSTADEVVTPTDSARLDGALDIALQDACPVGRVSHGDLPGNRVVVGALPQLLGRALPVALTRADCVAFSS